MNQSMFASMQKALQDKANKPAGGGGGGNNNLLRMEVGKTYIVKLLPYEADPANKTFLDYFIQSWASKATGRYASIVSPTSFGNPDPISTYRFRTLNSPTASDELKKEVDQIRRGSKTRVNVLVVDDPTNPENNGKVKILQYGVQLKKIIDSGIFGADSEDYGQGVFELKEGGYNLRITVEDQAGFPNYTSSRFTKSGSTNFTEERKKEILDSCFDLATTIKNTTTEEAEEFLKEHWLDPMNGSVNTKTQDDRERIVKELTGNKTSTVNETINEPAADDDQDIKDMLSDLGLA